MYFVHPQLKFKDSKKILISFFKKPDFKILKEILSSYFPQKNFLFVDMGRTAFKIIIERANLRESEILVPAFLCDIFFPIFKQYQISPVFLDVNLKTFQPEIKEIERKITKKTKAILILHTFGLPFKEIESVKNFNLILIEDCAHSFFAKIDGKFCGNFGDFAFFSLYKQFPTMRGGILITKEDLKDVPLFETKFSPRDFLSFLNSFSFFAFLFKKFGGEIAMKMIKKEKKEKFGKINNVSLSLFLNFFFEIEKNLEKRKELACYFKEKLEKLDFLVQEEKDNVFCYFSALVPENLKEKRDKIVISLRKEGVFCTRIWKDPIILNPQVQKEYQIDLSEFKNTVEISKRIVNFPLQNYFQKKDVDKIVKNLEKVLKET